jgi:hypothetical protein
MDGRPYGTARAAMAAIPAPVRQLELDGAGAECARGDSRFGLIGGDVPARALNRLHEPGSGGQDQGQHGQDGRDGRADRSRGTGAP